MNGPAIKLRFLTCIIMYPYYGLTYGGVFSFLPDGNFLSGKETRKKPSILMAFSSIFLYFSPFHLRLRENGKKNVKNSFFIQKDD